MNLAQLPVLAEQLATTGGTFDPVPWIVGGLIAIALGAFAMVILGRRRRHEDDAEIQDSPERGELGGRETTAAASDAEGDGLIDDSWRDKP